MLKKKSLFITKQSIINVANEDFSQQNTRMLCCIRFTGSKTIFDLIAIHLNFD